MKLAVRIALAFGLTVMIVLIIREGGPPILTLLASAGWVLLLLVPLHAVPLVLDVTGWRLLIRRLARPPALATLFWIAAVREAIDRLLPVANIGGEIVGIRLLAAEGVQGTAATATVVIEVLLTLVSQYLFITLGIVLALRSTHSSQPLGGLLLGLGCGLALIALLAALLRYGAVFERLESLFQRMMGMSRGALPSPWNDPGSTDVAGSWKQLDATIRKLYATRARLVLTVFWQLCGLVSGTFETWLALRWLGHPIDFDDSLSLESLTQGIRQFIFLVPAGLGVQEAGLVGLGAVLGLPPDVAIALSLVKRMREILFGVPALISWQWAEGWRGLPRKT
ncbi:MAG TPA: flippase-like domain-containing protein [Steroidobacteraceae bacterium]|nr:flippase-like domain-containing protein [Steroidobacteraceae bacterium]